MAASSGTAYPAYLAASGARQNAGHEGVLEPVYAFHYSGTVAALSLRSAHAAAWVVSSTPGARGALGVGDAGDAGPKALGYSHVGYRLVASRLGGGDAGCTC